MSEKSEQGQKPQALSDDELDSISGSASGLASGKRRHKPFTLTSGTTSGDGDAATITDGTSKTVFIPGRTY